MKNVLIMEAEREGYGIDQVKRTMTVGELKALLEDYDDNTELYISHDNGYTYGGFLESNFTERTYDEENDEYMD